jgi:hypothetical protein
LGKSVSDRRVHILGAIVASVTIGWVVWQSLPPTSSPQVAPTMTRPEPVPAPIPGRGNEPPSIPNDPPGEPVRPEDVTPPPNPAPGRGNPTVTRGGRQNEASPKPSTSPAPARPISPEPKVAPPANDPPGPAVAPEPQKPLPSPEPPAAANPPPEPIPTPRPPQPAAPPQPDLAAERAAIQQLLSRYVAAYNALDEGQLRRIDPGFTSIANRVVLKSLELRVSGVSIDFSPDGQLASLRATQNFSYVWNRSGYPPTSAGTLTWRLRKAGDTWIVVP